MSTLINFSIFPLDKGESVSVYVARVLEIVRTVDWLTSSILWGPPSKVSGTKLWAL